MIIIFQFCLQTSEVFPDIPFHIYFLGLSVTLWVSEHDTVWENQGFIPILATWRLSPTPSSVSWFPNPSGMRKGQCFLPFMHSGRTENLIPPWNTERRHFQVTSPIILCYVTLEICGRTGKLSPSVDSQVKAGSTVCKEWNILKKQTYVHKRCS